MPMPMSTAPARPKPDVALQTLERVDRLLLGVRDDEFPQLADRLLGVVGHSSPVRSGARVSSAGSVGCNQSAVEQVGAPAAGIDRVSAARDRSRVRRDAST